MKIKIKAYMETINDNIHEVICNDTGEPLEIGKLTIDKDTEEYDISYSKKMYNSIVYEHAFKNNQEMTISTKFQKLYTSIRNELVKSEKAEFIFEGRNKGYSLAILTYKQLKGLLDDVRDSAYDRYEEVENDTEGNMNTNCLSFLEDVLNEVDDYADGGKIQIILSLEFDF